MAGKILYFMPDNPLKSDAGNKARARSFLDYFANRGFEVDFFSERIWGEWADEHISEFENSGLATNVYVLDRKPSRENKLKYSFVKLIEAITNKVNGIDTRSMSNHATSYLRRSLEKIVKTKQYDYVIINYVTWANLAADRKIFKGAKLIIDTHDFLTSQKQTNNLKRVGKSFSDELLRLQLFDDIWAISPEEYYVFGQFLGDKVRWIPMMTESHLKVKRDKKEYDFIYIASNNNHNIASIEWFMDKVYPLLPANVSICIIGKITDYVDDKPNITKLRFVDDLSVYYSMAKFAICPMLSGTGLKIKVVEAMSYGMPIVCNERGLDGVPNRFNNGCIVTNDAVQFAQGIRNLITDDILYKRLSKESADLFDLCFNLKVGYERLDRIFNIEDNE